MDSNEIQNDRYTAETDESDGTLIEQYLIYAKKAREQGYEYIAQMFEEAFRSYLKDNSEYR